MPMGLVLLASATHVAKVAQVIILWSNLEWLHIKKYIWQLMEGKKPACVAAVQVKGIALKPPLQRQLDKHKKLERHNIIM